MNDSPKLLTMNRELLEIFLEDYVEEDDHPVIPPAGHYLDLYLRNNTDENINNNICQRANMANIVHYEKVKQV